MVQNCILFSLFTIFILPTLVIGCAQQYRRELNYLDFYLGIRPANEQGEIGVQGGLGQDIHIIIKLEISTNS